GAADPPYGTAPGENPGRVPDPTQGLPGSGRLPGGVGKGVEQGGRSAGRRGRPRPLERRAHPPPGSRGAPAEGGARRGEEEEAVTARPGNRSFLAIARHPPYYLGKGVGFGRTALQSRPTKPNPLAAGTWFIKARRSPPAGAGRVRTGATRPCHPCGG